MGYFLGIDVGVSRTVAAVSHSGSDPSGNNSSGTGGAETVDLGDPDGDGEGVASVLHLGEDGTLAVGAAAQRWAPSQPDRVVEGFPGRIGDGDPMLLAGEPWAPEELTAWLVRWVVDRVAEHEGAEAEAVAVVRPASWDDARTGLLAAALAEQEIDARFLAAGPGDPDADGDTDGDTAGDPQLTAAAVAMALREATAGERPGGTTASGRHAVVGGAIAALAAAPVPDEPASSGAGDAEHLDGDTAGAEDDHGAGENNEAEAEDAASAGLWDVPAPRSHQSGAYEPDVPGPDVPGPEEPGEDEPGPQATDAEERGPDGPGPDPATRNLIAELVGFTGGMGATNTAGLLSGYTPPHGMPAAWSGGPIAVAPAEAAPAETATATGSAVALPSQRSGSGRWSAVAPVPAGATRAAPALRARNNPTVLVGAGGLAAAVAVVGTLFLWPTPRITNSATSRPIPAVPVASARAEPTAAPTVALTPEPTPTPRPRPAAPRTRRPVVPPVTESATGTTPPPTASTEPAEPTTSVPPSTEETAPTTTASDDD